MQKWEYMCIQAPHTRAASTKVAGENAVRVPQVEAIMNALGDEGWELVCEWNYAVSGKAGPTLLFKRPREQ